MFVVMWLGMMFINMGLFGMCYVFIFGIGVVIVFGLFVGFCICCGLWKLFVGWSVVFVVVVVVVDVVVIGIVGMIFGMFGFVVGWFGSLLFVFYGYVFVSDLEDECEEGLGVVMVEELGER